MEWGKDAVAGGPMEAGASGRPALPDPVEPDSDGGGGGGLVVKNLTAWAK